jgi:hypothetical protein
MTFPVFYAGGKYTGLFFPKVGYIRYDILCFLEAGS